MALLDIKAIREEAEKEFAEEKSKEAKGKIKTHMAKIEQAKLVVRNLERELDDLMQKITE